MFLTRREALFEPNSYGFRPGRSCQDAIYQIKFTIQHKAKYVLDADIAKCFDRINHGRLLQKLRVKGRLRQQIKSWLKAGVIDKNVFAKTEQGTPQGGVISPLLANVALHGMEEGLNILVEKTVVLQKLPKTINLHLRGVFLDSNSKDLLNKFYLT